MTSTGDVELRAAIKFCVGLEKTPSETFNMLQSSSTTQKCCRALDFKWHRRFLQHPPYSTELDPFDLGVFPEIKAALRGVRFENANELRLYTQTVISSYGSDWFSDKWLQRHRNCIQIHGDYVEKV
jgi:hypothetical protein